MTGNGPVAVLANPTAGRGRHRRLLPDILHRLRGSGRAVRSLSATDRRTAERACQAAVADGAGTLVVIGGDGTLHAAVQAAAETKVAFAVVPAGSGNDFAAALGYPTDPVAAAAAIAAALRDNATRMVDLAQVTAADGTCRWFATVLAAGFDSLVNERANQMRWPRGDRRYDLAIFLELARLRPRPYQLKLDGVAHRFDAVLVAVGNTASYGGGLRICPDAEPADGLLQVLVGAGFTRRELVRIKPRVYRGDHVEHRLVHSYRARTVELAAEGITAYADGERLLPLPVTITNVSNALRVLAA